MFREALISTRKSKRLLIWLVAVFVFWLLVVGGLVGDLFGVLLVVVVGGTVVHDVSFKIINNN